MTKEITRRRFLQTAGTIPLVLGITPSVLADLKNRNDIKPIEGSWFEFQHHSAEEGKYWNHTLVDFPARQWKQKIKEIAKSGIRYLVLLDTAIYGKSFYPSRLLSQHQMNCDDPLEVVLTAADRYGVKFFISNGFYGEWRKPAFLMRDPEVEKLRLAAMNELAEKYGHHKSFYGWYYPNETGIQGHYDDFFIDYVNRSTEEAKRLTPRAKTLIAPYGTRNVLADDTYVRQLEMLDVDFIAYQDEIGVEKTQVDESASFFERLYKLHQKAAKSRLWADVEVFRFEGPVYRSALLPASPDRVIEQLKAVSPFVEKIFIYQYMGLINRPGTKAFAGHEDSYRLFGGLQNAGVLK